MISKPTESTTAMDVVEDASEPIHWGIERTKLLSDIRASDIPCGLSAYDIAIDFLPETY